MKQYFKMVLVNFGKKHPLYLDEPYLKTRHMIAICLSSTPDQPDHNKGWWKPLCEDPFDKHPVTDARWVGVDACLAMEGNR